MRFNIIPIDEMINIIDEFFKSNKQVLHVNQMIGCELFSYVTSYAVEYCKFDHILFVEGCQDFIGLSKTKSPNYMYYPCLLEERNPDSIIPYNPFQGKWFNPKREYKTIIDFNRIACFKCLIINNAQLMDPILIAELKKVFEGKIVIISDPFDIDGYIYSNEPTIVDTFVKLPTICAMARRVYGIETRFIDKHKSSLTTTKMGIRSIGKIDDKQYISNDPEIISLVRAKQYKSEFRKNQKLIITPKNPRKKFDGFGNGYDIALYKDTMMTITTSQMNPWMEFRIHHSKDYVKCAVTYDLEYEGYKVNVSPANIITIDQMSKHRFKNMVFVYNQDLSITQAERYSIIKNTNNLQVVIK